MGLGIGLILTAVGAVLAWAVKVDTNGAVDLVTVGYILLVVGIVAIVLSLAFWSTWAGPGYFTRGRTSLEDDLPRRRVVEREIIE
jgi:hypothetical protein